MDDQNNITTLNPAPSQAPGVPSNQAGPTASEQPASPMSGESQAAVSSDPGEISNSERIATLEAQIQNLAGVIAQGNAGTVPVQIAAQENGQRVDHTVQVPLRDFLIGLAGKVGYAHRVSAPEGS